MMTGTMSGTAGTAVDIQAGGHAGKRGPSGRQFAARQVNAERIAARIAKLLEDGHRVYDDGGDEVIQVSRRENGDIVYAFREGGNVLMFLADSALDNGAIDSVADYNASFDGWSFVHPKHIRPLKI